MGGNDYLKYSRANESVAAVMLGLDLQADDEVYAVGGSGDYGFAMLEYVKRVVVVDNNSKQVELMRKRGGFLSRLDIEGFLGVERSGERDNSVFGEDFPEYGHYNLGRRDSYFRSLDSSED